MSSAKLVIQTEPNITDTKSQQFSIPRIDTVFKLHRPGPPLSTFVEVFWFHESRIAERKVDRILPTGTLELVVNLRQSELSFYDSKGGENVSEFSGAVVSGAQSKGLAPSNPEHTFLIGVHFKPGGAKPFLGVPASELTDTHVDLDTLWGTSAIDLRERLCDSKTFSDRFKLLEEALLRRLRGGEQHYAVRAALEKFAQRPETSVGQIAKHVGLSQRRLIQAFKHDVGLTPKLFSRIQRFQRTRVLLHNDRSPNWPALALDSGYCDQSHLIREFHEFSGESPTEYLNRVKPLI